VENLCKMGKEIVIQVQETQRVPNRIKPRQNIPITGSNLAGDTGDVGSIQGMGGSTGEGIGYLLQYSWAFLVAQLVKNRLQCGRPGIDPGLGRSPGEGKSYPLQYSGLENSMDYRVAKSQT